MNSTFVLSSYGDFPNSEKIGSVVYHEITMNVLSVSCKGIDITFIITLAEK